MLQKEFEELLNAVAQKLTAESKTSKFEKSKDFETAVRNALQKLGQKHGISIDFNPHPYVFPDIVIGEYGIEVKFTEKDTWRSVANSVFEGTRSESVKHIYVLFGKMGGKPEVKWGKYEDCVMHVRTSHVPRFEVEINAEKSLFQKMGVTYDEFLSSLPEEKMKHVRKYARGRLKQGERLWWLEDTPDQGHSLPIQARLYMSLEENEKRMLRAEATLLCPQVVKSGRSRTKYNDPALYAFTYRGIICPQVRDLFSAGSVADKGNKKRGGIYVQRATQDIQEEMLVAAQNLDDALFVEYWGQSCKPSKRIDEWLRRADELAVDWKPSAILFLDRKKK